MRIYLAGRYSRREELLGVRDVIEALGGEVTARWLNGDHQLDDRGVPIGEDGAALVEGETFSERDRSERAAYLRAKFAQDDVEDVERSDMLIAFTEEPRSSSSRGGRHVELGIALALAKRVIVVGPLNDRPRTPARRSRRMGPRGEVHHPRRTRWPGPRVLVPARPAVPRRRPPGDRQHGGGRMIRTPRPLRFRLPDRTPPFDPRVPDDGCVVCQGPANGRLHCVDHEPTYPARHKACDVQTEASR